MQVADILLIAGAASIALMCAAIPLVEKYLPPELREGHTPKASKGSAPPAGVEPALHEQADNDNAQAAVVKVA